MADGFDIQLIILIKNSFTGSSLSWLFIRYKDISTNNQTLTVNIGLLNNQNKKCSYSAVILLFN